MSFRIESLLEELKEFLEYHGFDGRIEKVDSNRVMITLPDESLW